jgi:hypothetical protein
MRWQVDPAKVSTQQRRAPEHLKAAETMLVKFERVVREGPGINWVRQRALCSLYFFVAECWQASGDTKSALRAWSNIRSRALGPWHLHAAGAFLLILASLGLPTQRAIHKWKVVLQDLSSRCSGDGCECDQCIRTVLGTPVHLRRADIESSATGIRLPLNREATTGL